MHRRFGLIGHPIGHSLSPALFRAGYDGRYPYGLIETAEFDEAYSIFLKEYDGINVTAPFKELAFAKADILSEECRVIGATNLMMKTPDGVKAYNSDFLGVRLWLQEILHDESDQLTDMTEARETKVLIAGCGGAGKAAAMAAASLGCRTFLMNRDMKKAYDLSARLGTSGYETEVRPIEEFVGSFTEADVVIYNIPTAIGQLEELKDTDFGKGRPKHIMEANYRNPSFDKELIQKMTESNPLTAYTGGKTWLLYQAFTGYEIFTGEKPDLGKMSDVM